MFEAGGHRDGIDDAIDEACGKGFVGAVPVIGAVSISYTHLDVYKRQGLGDLPHAFDGECARRADGDIVDGDAKEAGTELVADAGSDGGRRGEDENIALLAIVCCHAVSPFAGARVGLVGVLGQAAKVERLDTGIDTHLELCLLYTSRCV